MKILELRTKYIIKRYVGEIDKDDSLYFQPFYDFFGNDALENAYAKYINIKKDEYRWCEEGSPIPIETVQKNLEELIKKGATHVEIMFHTDHDNYVFNGVEIRKANQQEINQFETETKQDNKAMLKQKKEELKKKIEEIDKELDKNNL